MITNDSKVYTHPKELLIGTEYANAFTEATVNNKKFNTVKAYVCCKIKAAGNGRNEIELYLTHIRFLYDMRQ